MKYSILALFFVLISCSKSENKDYVTKNDTDIQAYIAANNLVAQKTASGLYYVINQVGTGKQPTASSNVTVAYKGYFTDKKIFDQSEANGISFGLNGVIPGWTEGLQYFKEGGKGILLIPSRLGYGSEDYSSIPGGSVLIFDINVISVK